MRIRFCPALIPEITSDLKLPLAPSPVVLEEFWQESLKVLTASFPLRGDYQIRKKLPMEGTTSPSPSPWQGEG